MRSLLRCILVACLLLQLTRAERNDADDELVSLEEEDAELAELSPWDENLQPEDFADEPPVEENDEDKHLVVEEKETEPEEKEENRNESEGVVEPAEENEELHEERPETPIHEWKPERDLNVVHYDAESRDPVREHRKKDESLAAYVARLPRLEDEETEPSDRRLQEGSGSEETVAMDGALDEDEEESLPLIPGLLDVDLVAFNAEFANEEVLDKIIDWSYDQIAAVSPHRDNFVHVEDLYEFLLKTLNPLDEEIDQEDEEILKDAVTKLRKQQGLEDDAMVLYRGFIARGMPLRFLQSLAHEMHRTVQTRRLQTAGEL